MSTKRALASIPSGSVEVEGMLELPDQAGGIVLFAHGSGSGRMSPRNNFVANILHGARLATLLMDLLTPAEDESRQNRFDIPLLTQRLHAAALWLRRDARTRDLPFGLFGASTGAAAALQLAAIPNAGVRAVVSRGGRPDLAGPEVLRQVQAPTLLIVGGLDDVVLGLNRDACAALHCEKDLAIVPGASHLFEEPGTLETAAQLACAWFVKHLPAPPNTTTTATT